MVGGLGGTDLVVVGGGPAGLASAIFAARSGLSVTLFEQRALPADKACGEGLMPGGVALLQEMGVRPSRSRPFEGIRYLDESSVVEGRFGKGVGLGIRRFDLSRALVARAAALGVEVRDETEVRGVRLERRRAVVQTASGDGARDDDVEARWLIAADGLRSPIRSAVGLELSRPSARLQRFGWRRHYRVPPWSTFVEVHWSENAEAYVTPVAEDEIGIAVLWHGARPKRDVGAANALTRFPRLAARVEGAPTVSAPRGAGPLRQGVRRVTKGPLALVGDAAGYVDALTGEGLALGFRAAKAAVAAIADGDLGRYERDYRKLSLRYRASTELALTLAAAPRFRRLSLRLLARRPGLFERFLAWMT